MKFFCLLGCHDVADGDEDCEEKYAKELQARALLPTAVTVVGNYTNPRSWGVYRVESFKAGRRGNSFHIGNHPVRQNELIREHGSAELVMLFGTRIDAEHLKYLLSNNLVSAVEGDA